MLTGDLKVKMELVYEEIDYPSPSEILDELDELEAEIQQGLSAVRALLD